MTAYETTNERPFSIGRYKTRTQRLEKCDRCGGRLNSVYYFDSTADEQGKIKKVYVRIGYYCKYCWIFFPLKGDASQEI